MKFRIGSNIFAAVSMILAVIVWSIVCYCFIVNSMILMSVIIIGIRGSIQMVEFDEAIPIIFLVVRMICEGSMVAALTVQFLSSYERITCDCDSDESSYDKTWRKCHTNVLILNSVVLIIMLGVFIIPMNFDTLYEVFAITLNVIFLIAIAIVFSFDSKLRTSLPFDSFGNANNVENDEESNRPSYNLNIRSFLDQDPFHNKNSVIIV